MNHCDLTITECSESRYGQGCSKLCNKRKCIGERSCDHVTGKCLQGCDRGYQSEDCTNSRC